MTPVPASPTGHPIQPPDPWDGDSPARGNGWPVEGAGVGAYYTPARILAIIEPCMGSGSWLAELASNPPFEVTR